MTMYIRIVLQLMFLWTTTCVPISNNIDVERHGKFPDFQYVETKHKDPVYIEEYIPNDTEHVQYIDTDTGTIEDTDIEDAKRGIENIPSLWIMNRKRALQVVNMLWEYPELRRRYLNTLRNQKRSKEYIEHVPVQPENQPGDGVWMIDEIGYYADPNISEDPEELIDLNVDKTELNKRGWDHVRPPKGERSRAKNSFTSYSIVGKRGWEPIRNLVGKRAWEPIRSFKGKRGWEPVRNLVGKRGWEPIENLVGKRGWEPVRNLVGKRGWEPVWKLVGKRGWEPISFQVNSNSDDKSKRTLAGLLEFADRLTEQTSENSDLQQSLTNLDVLRNYRSSSRVHTGNVDNVEHSNTIVTL